MRSGTSSTGGPGRGVGGDSVRASRISRTLPIKISQSEKVVAENTIFLPYPTRWSEPVWFVYVVAVRGFAKVGLAQDVKKRLTSIQNGCPLEAALVHTEGPMSRIDARAIEKTVRVELTEQHARGEWYASAAVDVVRCVRQARILQ